MSFWTAPILIAHLSTPDVAARRNVGGVFEITKSNLINDDPLAALAPLDKNIVRFDVYDVLAIIIARKPSVEGSLSDQYAQCFHGAAQQDQAMYLSKCAW